MARQYFNPRSPCGERHHSDMRLHRSDNFNPRSPCGERPPKSYRSRGIPYFNPRSPCGERLSSIPVKSRYLGFQSTLPLRGATRPQNPAWKRTAYFNPRSPCGERPRLAPECHRFRYFNPRSPCGERLMETPRNSDNYDISIHAPLAGSDSLVFLCLCVVLISIHAPLAGSDQRGYHAIALATISIHAPLAGSDHKTRYPKRGNTHFNPRSPCGERPAPETTHLIRYGFQSTLPLRGATA